MSASGPYPYHQITFFDLLPVRTCLTMHSTENSLLTRDRFSSILSSLVRYCASGVSLFWLVLSLFMR